MTDVLFLVLIVAFFGLAVVFVRGCERIIGTDLEATASADTAEPDRAAA